MNWLPSYDQGKTPADYTAGMMTHAVGLPSELLRRKSWQEQLADAVRGIAPVISDYIQRKKSDEIANQLLQLEHAPQELQGKGQLGLHGAQLFQQYQQDQEANRPDTEMDNERWLQLHRANHPEEYPNQGKPMTQYQQEHLDMMRRRENRLGADTSGTDNTLGMGAQAFEDALMGGGIQKTTDTGGKTHVTVTPKGGLPVEVKENDLNQSVNKFRAEQDRMKARVSTTNLPPEGVSGSISRSPDQAKERMQSESLTAPTPQDQGAPRGMTKADYDAMPSGTVYTAPDGSRRVKK